MADLVAAALAAGITPAQAGWLIIVGGILAAGQTIGVALTRCHCRTTRGGARPEAAAPRVAVQPAATAGLQGRPGRDPAGRVGETRPAGHPDDLMAVAAAALTPDEVPVVPGLSADDMVGRTVMAAIDLLAASLLASNEGDEDGAQRCEDRCRDLLADNLPPADLVDVLMEELMCSAGDRARAIRAETDALDPAAIGGAL